MKSLQVLADMRSLGVFAEVADEGLVLEGMRGVGGRQLHLLHQGGEEKEVVEGGEQAGVEVGVGLLAVVYVVG